MRTGTHQLRSIRRKILRMNRREMENTPTLSVNGQTKPEEMSQEAPKRTRKTVQPRKTKALSYH